MKMFISLIVIPIWLKFINISTYVYNPNIHTPLSSELLQQIHVLMTEKTLENPADAGAYRTNDEVVVEDAITHEVVHTPPHTKTSLHLLKIYAYSSMKVILKYLFTQ